jgi:aspartate/methionine/tyrosine aminotransferase
MGADLPPCHFISAFLPPSTRRGFPVALPLFVKKLLIQSGIARWLPSVQRLTDGGADFLHYYSDRLLAAPHLELGDLAALLDAHGPDVIDLTLGSPRFDLMPSGGTKLPADRRGWPPPWGLPELRAAIAETLLAGNGLAVSPADEVLVTHGAAGAFSTAIDTFVNPGDRIVLFDPTSPLYPLMLRSRRACVHWVPTWMEEGRLRFRLDHLDKALRGARLLVVTSPANPTGGIISPEDLEQIAWWADHRDVLLFNDAAFERYRYEGEVPSIGTLPRARQRTLTAGSVSKGHALASARVGWLAGCRHLVRACSITAALQTPFVPTLCQQLALTALRQSGDPFQQVLEQLDSRRHYAFDRLRSMGLNPAWPSGAFFFWVPVWELGLSGRAFAEHLLREKSVLVTPGTSFGPSGAGHVRLSYAVEDGRLREGLGRMAELLRSPQENPEKELVAPVAA